MSTSGISRSTDGTEIAWSTAGSGPALVVIDPIVVDRDLSPNGPLVELLSRDFTVIRYDRRGKGESTLDAPNSPSGEIEDLRAVITAASDDPSPSVYGLSSGGSIALLAAGRGVSMKSLVVMEPPSRLPEIDGFIAETERKVAAGQHAEAIRDLWTYQGMPSDVIDQMGALAEACAPYAHTIPVDLQIANLLTPEAVARVAAPTLAVASLASPPLLQGFAEYVAEQVPAGSTAILDGDWHGIPDDDLARAITHFIVDD